MERIHIQANTKEGWKAFWMPFLSNPTKLELRNFAIYVRNKRPHLPGELLRGTKVDDVTYWWSAFDLTHERFCRLMKLPTSTLSRADLALKSVPRLN